VFVSGNPTEPFGIAYLEALSQGCAVAMPASGGGLEIAPELIGRRIFLFSSSINRHAVVASLRNALHARPMATTPDAYSACAVAEAYLARDLRFTALGAFPPEPIQ
jgi:glycosyltransferase involved in cell wall biosynthesis